MNNALAETLLGELIELKGQRRRADHGYGPLHCVKNHRG
jgi:hypothetical protein